MLCMYFKYHMGVLGPYSTKVGQIIAQNPLAEKTLMLLWTAKQLVVGE